VSETSSISCITTSPLASSVRVQGAYSGRNTSIRSSGQTCREASLQTSTVPSACRVPNRLAVRVERCHLGTVQPNTWVPVATKHFDGRRTQPVGERGVGHGPDWRPAIHRHGWDFAGRQRIEVDPRCALIATLLSEDRSGLRGHFSATTTAFPPWFHSPSPGTNRPGHPGVPARATHGCWARSARRTGR
jgi:hypothetical protein